MIENTISTNENLVQDNSSIEYVSPETNTIATTTHSEQLFDFNAEHNGEACIESLDPKDRGTERRFRFTRALLCTLLGVKSENTITNHVQALINRGVIDNVKNLTLYQSPSMSMNRSGLFQIVSWKSARRTQTESSGVWTAMVRDCFPNGRVTYWTKCMRTTTCFC